MLNTMKCLNTFPGLKWLTFVPIMFLLDQVSKWLVLKYIPVGESLKILPKLNIIHAHNHGIAFSLLNTQAQLNPMWLLAGILLISVVLGGMLVKTPFEDKSTGIPLVLIFGGALGNICDRVWHGYVIDFIDFYIGSWHWYTFNFADAFITFGALLMIKNILSKG